MLKKARKVLRSTKTSKHVICTLVLFALNSFRLVLAWCLVSHLIAVRVTLVFSNNFYGDPLNVGIISWYKLEMNMLNYDVILFVGLNCYVTHSYYTIMM